MANFAGFEIETPQELQRRLAEQRQAIFGNPDSTIQEKNFAAFDSGLKAIFGDPEMDKAEARMKAAEAAFSDLNKESDEDDIAFRQRQVQTFFDEVKDTDPALAAQAAEQLTALQNERFERDVLRAAEGRRIRAEEREVESFENERIFANTAYVKKPDGNLVGFDLTDPEQVSAYQQAAAQPGSIGMTREEATDYDREARVAADNGVTTKTGHKKRLNEINATKSAVRRASRIAEMLVKDPNVLTTAQGLQKAVVNLSQEFGAAAKALDIREGKLKRGQEWVAERASEIAPEARARGVTDALILDLAYSMARMRDPGGRLSDKDVELAISMIGGRNASPDVVYRTLLEQTALSVRDHRDSMKQLFAAEGFADTGQGRQLGIARDQLDAEYDRLLNRAGVFLPENEISDILYGMPLTEYSVTPTTDSTTVVEIPPTPSAPAEGGEAPPVTPVDISIIGID